MSQWNGAVMQCTINLTAHYPGLIQELQQRVLSLCLSGMRRAWSALRVIFYLLYKALSKLGIIYIYNYNIKYICTIYTRLYTCLTPIPRFALRDKVTLRLFKLLFLGSGCSRVVQGAGRKAKRMVLQCNNGVGSNPVEGRTKI